MKRWVVLVGAVAAFGTAYADDSRQLDAHEHGVGTLNIAIEGTTVAMELRAPGADIVGFEYVAESAEDRASITEAVARLARPQELFVLPSAAECIVTEASAEIEGGGGHDAHADTGHDHDDHSEAERHTEFHAEYVLSCTDSSAVDRITFAYFDVFVNARELDVQLVSDVGARSFEVTRDVPVLDLRGLF